VNVALGLKAHSGWAALVSIGRERGVLVVSTRRRIELVDEPWAKQPYHAAEPLEPEPARRLVARGIEMTRRLAVAEMQAAVADERSKHNAVNACAVLVGAPMPPWTVDEILAVHVRMHKAEGVLFREVLAYAATECALKLVAISEKQLHVHAQKTLGTPATRLSKQIAALGATVGAPWGKDQKDAALAALIALEGKAAGAGAART
jgi:hypothetical protein